MMTANPALRIAVPDVIDPAVFRSFDARAPVVRLSGQTMGTSWHVRAALPAAGGISADKLQRLVQARLDGIVADLSHWEPDSWLSRFNHADAGSMLPMSDDCAKVMVGALAIAEASGGAFDPALGWLTDLWGLGPRPVTQHPDPVQIRLGLRSIGWQRLELDARYQTLRQPGGVWLDLSGIAKGFAVDAVADLLAKHGVHHALVEIGGECAGRGIRPDGDPWWVDIENPPGTFLPPLRVALHQLAIATSGDYLRGAHSLVPQTGLPAIGQTTAVTVIHRSCMEADAWATALSVVDSSKAQVLARRHRMMVRIVLRDDREWISPALRTMMADAAAAA